LKGQAELIWRKTGEGMTPQAVADGRARACVITPTLKRSTRRLEDRWHHSSGNRAGTGWRCGA